MHLIVNKAQSAIIPGKSISDNILLAQKLFRGYGRETGVSKCSSKVDLHKAFDSIDWDFILTTLCALGFPVRLCSWIKVCICTTHFSIKLNGILHDYFKGAKCLREGDPLSPYLFSVAMTVFSSILDDKLKGFKHHWRCQDLCLTHLIFADDVLFFCHGNKASIGHIMQSIDFFSKISGLSPNMLTSTSFFNNCEADTI